MMKKILVYLFDGFSDWEISYVTPEIHKSDHFDLLYFSEKGESVTSMGGLHVTPAISLDQVKPDQIDMLILPGGTAWEEEPNTAIEPLVRDLFQREGSIAAICAATTYLGQLGLLDHVSHTSNHLDYLKGIAPSYAGETNYRNTLAVRDKQIITANGIAPVEFAREIFNQIELYSPDQVDNWFQLFKHGIWSDS